MYAIASCQTPPKFTLAGITGVWNKRILTVIPYVLKKSKVCVKETKQGPEKGQVSTEITNSMRYRFR